MSTCEHLQSIKLAFLSLTPPPSGNHFHLFNFVVKCLKNSHDIPRHLEGDVHQMPLFSQGLSSNSVETTKGKVLAYLQAMKLPNGFQSNHDTLRILAHLLRMIYPYHTMYDIFLYDGSSKVLFPLLALNRNSMRDAFCFTCKKSYTEDTSKMQ